MYTILPFTVPAFWFIVMFFLLTFLIISFILAVNQLHLCTLSESQYFKYLSYTLIYIIIKVSTQNVYLHGQFHGKFPLINYNYVELMPKCIHFLINFRLAFHTIILSMLFCYYFYYLYDLFSNWFYHYVKSQVSSICCHGE